MSHGRLTSSPRATRIVILACAALVLGEGKTSAGVVINEIIADPAGTDSGKQLVELYNTGPDSQDVSGWNLCIRHIYKSLPSGTILGPGETILVHLNATGPKTPGEFYTGSYVDLNASDSLGLYTKVRTMSDFGDPAFIRDYVEWGSAGQPREDVAGLAGIWPTGSFVPAAAEGHSIAYVGSGIGPGSWLDEPSPSPGAVNAILPLPSAVDPAVVCPGHQTAVSVSGSRFLYGATISMGSGLTVAPASFVDSTLLRTTITADTAASDGPRDLVVGNPGGSDGGLTSALSVDSAAPPDPPAGLTVASAADDSIELSWGDAMPCGSAVVSYEVTRDGAIAGTPSGTAFSDGGLGPGSSHTYVVRAVDATGGMSLPSIGICMTTTAPFLSPRLPCDEAIGGQLDPPAFLWNGGENIKWQLQFSLDPSFGTVTKAKKKWLKTTGFTPSLKTWLKALGIPVGGGGGGGGGGGYGGGYTASPSSSPPGHNGANGTATTLYWRVIGKDQAKALTTSPVFSILVY